MGDVRSAVGVVGEVDILVSKSVLMRWVYVVVEGGCTRAARTGAGGGILH